MTATHKCFPSARQQLTVTPTHNQPAPRANIGGERTPHGYCRSSHRQSRKRHPFHRTAHPRREGPLRLQRPPPRPHCRPPDCPRRGTGRVSKPSARTSSRNLRPRAPSKFSRLMNSCTPRGTSTASVGSKPNAAPVPMPSTIPLAAAVLDHLGRYQSRTQRAYYRAPPGTPYSPDQTRPPHAQARRRGAYRGAPHR